MPPAKGKSYGKASKAIKKIRLEEEKAFLKDIRRIVSHRDVCNFDKLQQISEEKERHALLSVEEAISSLNFRNFERSLNYVHSTCFITPKLVLDLIVKFLMKVFSETDNDHIVTVFGNEIITSQLTRVINGKRVLDEFITTINLLYESAPSDISELNHKGSNLKDLFEHIFGVDMSLT